MLYIFGFDKLSVAVGDLYFVNPTPLKGQESPEHGVRLELRRLQPGELKSSIYSSRPISIEEPIWRVDLLESVDGRPGSFDRTHHHPRFDGWNPGQRVFDRELSADPIAWLKRKLSDVSDVLTQAGVVADTVGPGDLTGLSAAAPEICDVVQRLLDRVRAGELGQAPDGPPSESVRASWL